MITKARKGKFIGGPYDGISQDMFVWDMSEFPKSLTMTKHPNMKPTLESIQKACSGESTCNFVDYKFQKIDLDGNVVYEFASEDKQV